MNILDHVDKITPYGKMFLIKPLLKQTQSKFQLFYNISSNIAIDEGTISFKGKISFKVFNKHNKFGIKFL